MEIFLEATRRKLRFVYNGSLTTEDLWDLKLEGLNTLAVELHNKIQKQSVSFISDSSPADETEKLKLEILKTIIQFKLKEKKDREDSLLKAEQKRKILDILERKRDESLNDRSEEELLQMLESL